MRFLENKLMYLGGPIQHCEAKTDWRPEVRDYLKVNFNLKVHDPFIDEKQIHFGSLQQAIEDKNYDLMGDISKNFVRKDLQVVDRSDFIIANLPYKVATYGTTEEIITAWRAKKPVLLHCSEGKHKIPAWFYGYIPHKYMFETWSDLFKYLHEVDDGVHKDDSRWAYVYGLI